MTWCSEGSEREIGAKGRGPGIRGRETKLYQVISQNVESGNAILWMRS